MKFCTKQKKKNIAVSYFVYANFQDSMPLLIPERRRFHPLIYSNHVRAATGTAAAAALEAALLKNERNPVDSVTCSSRKRSSGTLNAPWAQTRPTPTIRAETRTDPTLVRNTTNTLSKTKRIRVSLSLNVRPNRTSG